MSTENEMESIGEQLEEACLYDAEILEEKTEDHEVSSISSAPLCQSCNDSYAIELPTLHIIFNTKMRFKQHLCFECRHQKSLQVEKSFEDIASELGFQIVERRMNRYEEVSEQFQVENTLEEDESDYKDEQYTYCACCDCFVDCNPCSECKKDKTKCAMECLSCSEEENISKEQADGDSFVAEKKSKLDELFALADLERARRKLNVVQ